MANVGTNYMGLKLKSPIVVASSGLTNTVEKIRELEAAGAGAVVLKSLFEEQINAEVDHLINKDPQNLYPEAEDYIWNYTRNNSVTKHIELVKEAKKVVSIPVIASINCVSDKEWTDFAKELEQAGADALELNLFILPVQRQKSSAEIEQMYINVLTKVKKIVKIPVSIKIGFYFTSIVSMADRLSGAGASAIVAFNRFYEPDIDINNLEIVPAEVFSSPADIRRSLRWVGILSAAVPNLHIAASTGIHDSEAVIKQLLAGAQVVQLCSALYINGAQQIAGILGELTNFMKKWNFKAIDDFRGRLSYKNIPDPQLYERSQFMKYFSGKG
ncbi:MAG: dihydroorotate dehydrogenase-like protein [Prolixibacteraceae bacterium]|jgi:dihydroorotate dehydrogenase (fumarate)|nr:dihydroorotate dehydrogenase-like protein [Prolixibacteraceae bacterium]